MNKRNKGIGIALILIIGFVGVFMYLDKKEDEKLKKQLNKFRKEAYIDSNNKLDNVKEFVKKDDVDKNELIKLTGLKYNEAVQYVEPEYVEYNNMAYRIKLKYPKYLEAHEGDMNDVVLVSKAQTFDEESENIPAADIDLRISCFKNDAGYSKNALYDQWMDFYKDINGEILKSEEYGYKKVTKDNMYIYYVKEFGEDVVAITFSYDKTLEDICAPQVKTIIDSIEKY